MPYRGYFDESGDPRDPKTHAFVIGGAIADDHAWARFDEEWNEVLSAEEVRDRKGVQWLHSKDLLHGHGPFEGWERSRRVALFDRLRAVVRSHVGLIVVAYDLFDAFSPKTLGEQYLAGHEYVVRQGVASLLTHYQFDGAVDFIFAKRPKANPVEHHIAMGKRLRVAAPQLPIEISDSYSAMYARIGELRLAEPRESPPLQAADLIVSDVYQWLRTRELPLPEIIRSLDRPWVLRQVQWFGHSAASRTAHD